MKVTDTKLTDVKIVEMDVFGDHRGFFTESYSNMTLFKTTIHYQLKLVSFGGFISKKEKLHRQN